MMTFAALDVECAHPLSSAEYHHQAKHFSIGFENDYDRSSNKVQEEINETKSEVLPTSGRQWSSVEIESHHHHHHHHRLLLPIMDSQHPHGSQIKRKSYDEDINPFQNDNLPVWQGGKRSSNASSPVVQNNVSGASTPEHNQGHGYGYRSLNQQSLSPQPETQQLQVPQSPGHHSTTSGSDLELSPPGSPEIIQV